LEVPVADMDAELSLFLQPFIDRFGHKKRGAMCPLYIAGLLGPGDRKSRWSPAWLQDNTIAFIISFSMACGVMSRSGWSWRIRRTGWSGQTMYSFDR
jgi:hypothetical protein